MAYRVQKLIHASVSAIDNVLLYQSEEQMLRVRDIMTRKVISISGDTPIDAAAWRLASEGVSGAPVRDRSGNVIGVLTTRDLVDPMRHNGTEMRVEEVMTPAVWAVHPDVPAIEAVELMVTKNIHRVIVVRESGRLEGIVTSMDVMQALVDRRQFHSATLDTIDTDTATAELGT